MAKRKKTTKKKARKFSKKTTRRKKSTAKKTVRRNVRHKTSSQTPRKKLYRSKKNRIILGVCGGMADYFHADPVLVRILSVLVLLVTGIIPFVVAYLVAGVIIPEK